MDKKAVILLKLVFFVIMPVSVATETWKPYSRPQREDALYDNHYMASGLTSAQPQSDSHDFLFNGRDMLEDAHQIPSSMDAAHNQRDLDALLSFKAAITHDPTGFSLNWTAENGDELCAWEGIVCRQHTERVVAINLADLNLEGSIPVGLGMLQRLELLDLQFNEFENTIPQSLGNCSSLKYLLLGCNKLSGTIPPQLGNLRKLNELSIIGPDHIPGNISGFIPSELGNCSNMSILDLSGNKIQGSLPISIFGLPLTELSLRSNSLIGTIPDAISNLTQLTYLFLHSNKLSGCIPKAISDLSKLQFLSLYTNNLKGPISEDTGKLRSLQYLSLHSNHFTGSIPNNISGLVSLEYLDLSQNNLDGGIPKGIYNCTSLKWLKVSNNSLSGNLDIYFPTSLVILSANSNNFSHTLPMSLEKCTALQVLDLRNNGLTGELSTYLPFFHHLRVLSVGYNHFYGGIPQWITNLNQLQVLDFSNNHFSGKIPSNLHKLDGFKINGSSELNADTLYADLRVYIKGLEYILPYVQAIRTILDLSSNHLIGEIPSSIGNLSSLQLLNLSMNQLEGQIPASLSNIHTLEQLDLAQNNLSGKIPQQLSALAFLAYFNASNNNLCGSIPTGTQFTSWDETSFENNKCLCQYPLQRECNPERTRNSNENNDVEVGWLSHVNRKISLVALGVGIGIGFGGVISLFIISNKARYWIMGFKKPQPFYGLYRFPK